MNRAPLRPLTTRAPFMRLAVPVALVAGLAAVAAFKFEGTASANDEGRFACSNRTLRGDYGLIVSGVRALGPGVTESFIGTAIRTYDGRGSFEQVDNSHGTVIGAVTNAAATGTYVVNADSAGTSTLFISGAPPIDTAFVIVDRGNEVKDIVMAPQPNLVTAVLRKIGG
jgi:hypothetical protein